MGIRRSLLCAQLLALAITRGAAAEPVAAPDAPPTVEEIRDLIGRWVAAQNHGDFAAYQALYAADFHGVRRSGSKEKRFDRAGWMADRKRMFRHPMKVGAEDVRMDRIVIPPRVVIRQLFRQGSYHDQGDKLFTLVRGPDGWLIASEEMLGSRKVPVGHELSFGYDGAERLSTMRLASAAGDDVLLARVDEWFPHGPLAVVELVHGPGGLVIGGIVEAPLAGPSAGPPLAGAAVTVLDSDLADACRGTLGAPSLIAHAWLTTPLSDAAAVEAIWEQGTRLVHAELTTPDGCYGAYVRGPAAPHVKRPPSPSPGDRYLLTDGDDPAKDVVVMTGRERALATHTDAPAATCADRRVRHWALTGLVKDADAGWIGDEIASGDNGDRLVTATDVDGDGDVEAVLAYGLWRDGAYERWDWEADLAEGMTSCT